MRLLERGEVAMVVVIVETAAMAVVVAEMVACSPLLSQAPFF
jgi:hypothetical protein